MNSFFRTFFAALLALAVFAVVMFVVVIVAASSIASSKQEVTGENAVLFLDLSQHFPEIQPADPISTLTSGEKSHPTLYDVVRIIGHAKTNDAVKGIYVKCGDNQNDFAASSEIRDALIDFKTSKKFVFAYADDIPQRAYFVATAADKVYCSPTGHLEWKGFSMTLPFIKSMLDKLEIQPQIFYAGKFKSATEPLRDTQMTEANRLQSTELLNDIYGNYLSVISRSRKIDTTTLRRFADSSQVQFARQALQNKLVDGIRYDDEVKDEIRHKLRIDSDAKINFVSVSRYAEAEDVEKSGRDKIAVIYAEGTIVDGTGDRDRIGGETYRNHIRRARTDKSIKAIVIRINSGGGSASASEQMWREVDLARKVKPVIVSFGDVAASGGYYMACAADSIFVQPNTITGSIGVFGILPNMENFFRKKLGITFDEVSTSRDGSVSVTKPLTALQRKSFQSQIDTIYSDFKSHVASGRKKSADYIETIAQGRVWSGTRAVEIGLADRIGSLDDAITAAAAKAKITDYRLREYPGKQSFFEMLFSDNKESKKETMIREELGTDMYKTYSAIKDIQQMVGQAQARMPYEIVID